MNKQEIMEKIDELSTLANDLDLDIKLIITKDEEIRIVEERKDKNEK